MKHIILLVALTLGFYSNAQNEALKKMELEIIETVDSFFIALNQQDSVMLDRLVLRDGQVWSVLMGKEKKFRSRLFADDMKEFTRTHEWKEIAKDCEVHYKEGLAIAWVPYDFYLNGKLSHSGMNLFTLAPDQNGWKIIQVSYTVHKDKKINGTHE